MVIWCKKWSVDERLIKRGSLLYEIEKVFGALEKYSGEEFRKSITGQDSAVRKCTLVFDEDGDMTATLETGKEKRNAINQNTKLLYQNFFMQQAMRMSYPTNLYSGYHNLYGLNGLYK